jgi:DNA-binding transcriptional regulator of glucitol operon
MKNMGGGYFRLTPEQFEEIVTKGFIFVQPSPGRFKKITIDDILISEDDVNKMIEEKKKEKII